MNKDVRWQQRFNNYVKALRLLERVSKDVSIAEETGMLATIQAFEMVLELSWNLLKDKMSHDGLTFQPVPKTVYREAFNKGYINDAQVWLAAIEKQNLSSHTYNKEVAKELLDNILDMFLPAFQHLQQAANQWLAEETE